MRCKYIKQNGKRCKRISEISLCWQHEDDRQYGGMINEDVSPPIIKNSWVEELKNVLTNRPEEPTECTGWIECGKNMEYKGIDIWEISKNTILLKGVKPNSQSQTKAQSYKYINDSDYLPGQLGKIFSGLDEEYEKKYENIVPSWDRDIKTERDIELTPRKDENHNFIYLANDIRTAIIYAYPYGRIISCITLGKIKLLNLSSDRTMSFIYNQSSNECKEVMKQAFMIKVKKGDKGEKIIISEGRWSNDYNDFEFVRFLMKEFKWIDGYAYFGHDAQTGRKKGHEEIVIFNPSIFLKRYPMEYRLSGMTLDSYQNKNCIVYLFKVTDGVLEDTLFVIGLGKLEIGRNFGRGAGNEVYWPNVYNIDENDKRDNFLIQINNESNGHYYDKVKEMMINDSKYNKQIYISDAWPNWSDMSIYTLQIYDF